MIINSKCEIAIKSTVSGIEAMHMIYKGQIEEIRDVLSEVQFENDIMADAV